MIDAQYTGVWLSFYFLAGDPYFVGISSHYAPVVPLNLRPPCEF